MAKSKVEPRQDNHQSGFDPVQDGMTCYNISLHLLVYFCFWLI